MTLTQVCILSFGVTVASRLVVDFVVRRRGPRVVVREQVRFVRLMRVKLKWDKHHTYRAWIPVSECHVRREPIVMN